MLSMNQLVSHFVLFITITGTSTTDFLSSNVDPWQPVIKTNYSTREWKIQTIGHSSPTVDRNSLDRTKAANHYDSIPSETLHRAPLSLPDPYDSYHPHNHIPQHTNYHHEYHHDGHGYDGPPHPGASHSAPRYDPMADSDGYYSPSYAHYPSYGYGPPGPSYGPYGPSPPPPPPGIPPAPLPDDSVHIELVQDRLVIRCVAHEPLEHLVWTRFVCPNDYFYGHGIPVADGSLVYNTDLYDVRIIGENGDIASELLLRMPLDSNTSGLYICEAWPHYKKPNDLYGHHHYPPPMYPSVSDAFIIGGSELIEQCYYSYKQPFLHKTFPFKKRNDDTRQDQDEAKKKVKMPSTKETPPDQNTMADVTRKPRNMTSFRFSRRKQHSFGDDFFKNNELTEKSSKNQTNIFKNKEKHSFFKDMHKEHRYNFKFDNETKILNASVKDVFDKFTTLRLNDTRVQSNSKNRSFDKTLDFYNIRVHHFTGRPRHNKSNYNFMIDRMKYKNNEFESNYDDANDTLHSSESNWATSLRKI